MTAIDDVHPIEARLLRAFERIHSRALSERMRRKAIRAGITYEDDRGGTILMSYGLLPVVVPAPALERMAKLARAVEAAVQRLAPRWLDDPRLQEMLPLWDEEAAIWRETKPRGSLPMAGRLDATLACGRRDGTRDAMLYEWNGSCVGGLFYSPAEEELVSKSVLPALPREPIAPQPDLRDLLLSRVRTHRRRLGLRGAIAVLEDTRIPGGITEYPRIAAHFRACGEDAVYGDLRALDLVRDRLYLRGKRIAVVVRNFELRDLCEIERAEGRLEPVRAAFLRNQLVSSIAGELDHKSLWEVLQTPPYSASKALAAHLPWTRRLTERRTRLPGGQHGDLVRHVSRNRERLVLKPNRSCGGDGVTIGAVTSQQGWERTIDRALREGWVAQELLPFYEKELAYLPWKGDAVVKRLLVNYGIFATEGGTGLVGRVSTKPIINVSSGGAQTPMFVTVTRRRHRSRRD